MAASKHPRQPTAALSQQAPGYPQIPGRLRDLLGERIERECYVTTQEAAQLTGRPSREAFIRWARRHRIPLRRADGATRGPLVVKLTDIHWALRV